MPTQWDEFMKQIRLEETLNALRPEIAPAMASLVIAQDPRLMSHYLTPQEQASGPPTLPTPQPNIEHYIQNTVIPQAAAEYAAQQMLQQEAARQREAEAVRRRLAQEQAAQEAALMEQAGKEVAAAQIAAKMQEDQRTLGDQRLRPGIPHKPAAQNIPSAHHLQGQLAGEAAIAAAQPDPVRVLPPKEEEAPVTRRDPSWPDWYQPGIQDDPVAPPMEPDEFSTEPIEVQEAVARVDAAWEKKRQQEATNTYVTVLKQRAEEEGWEKTELKRAEIEQDLQLVEGELRMLRQDIAEGNAADSYEVNVLLPATMPTKLNPDGVEIIDEAALAAIPDDQKFWTPVELTPEEYQAYLEEKMEFNQGAKQIHQDMITVGFGVSSDITLGELMLGPAMRLGQLLDAPRRYISRPILGTLMYFYAQTPIAAMDEEVLKLFGGSEAFENWQQGIIDTYESEGATATYEQYMAQLPEAMNGIPVAGPALELVLRGMMDIIYDPLTWSTASSGVLAKAAIRSAQAGQAKRAAQLANAAKITKAVDDVTALPGLAAWEVLKGGGRIAQRAIPGADVLGEGALRGIERARQTLMPVRVHSLIQRDVPEAIQKREAQRALGAIRGVDLDDPIQRRGLIRRVYTPEEQTERVTQYGRSQAWGGRTLTPEQERGATAALRIDPPSTSTMQREVMRDMVDLPDGTRAGLRIAIDDDTGEIVVSKLEYRGGRRAGKTPRDGSDASDWRWSQPRRFEMSEAFDRGEMLGMAPGRIHQQSRQMAMRQAEATMSRAPRGVRMTGDDLRQMDVGRSVGEYEVIAADPSRSVRALYHPERNQVIVETFKGKNDGGWSRATSFDSGQFLRPEVVTEPDYHPIFMGMRQAEGSFVRQLNPEQRGRVYERIRDRLENVTWPRMHARKVADSSDEQRIWEMQLAADIIESTRQVIGKGEMPKWRLIHQVNTPEGKNTDIIERWVMTDSFEGDRAMVTRTNTATVLGTKEIHTAATKLQSRLKGREWMVPDLSGTGKARTLDPDDWYEWATNPKMLDAMDSIADPAKSWSEYSTDLQRLTNRLRNRWLLDNAQIRVAESFKGSPLEAWEKEALLKGGQIKAVKSKLLREAEPAEIAKEIDPPFDRPSTAQQIPGAARPRDLTTDPARASFQEIETFTPGPKGLPDRYQLDRVTGKETLEGLTKPEFDEKYGKGAWDKQVDEARAEVYDPFYDTLDDAPDIRSQTTPAGITPVEPREIPQTIRQYGATPMEAVDEIADPRLTRMTQPLTNVRARNQPADVRSLPLERQSIRYAQDWTVPEALYYQGTIDTEMMMRMDRVVGKDAMGNDITMWEQMDDMARNGAGEREMIQHFYKQLDLEEPLPRNKAVEIWRIVKALIRDNVMYTYMRGLMPISLDAMTDAAHAAAIGRADLSREYMRNHIDVLRKGFARDTIGLDPEKALKAQDDVAAIARDAVQEFEVVTGMPMPPNYSHGALQRMHNKTEALLEEEHLIRDRAYSTQAERIAGRLGQKAKTLTSIFGSSGRIKAIRTVQDDYRRIFTYQDSFRRNHDIALREFEDLVAEAAPKMGMEPDEAINVLRTIEPQSKIEEARAYSRVRERFGDWNPITPRDIELAFGSTEQGAMLARRWKNFQKNAGKVAENDTERLLFSYATTKLDEQIGQFVFFHYWMSRALKLQAELYFNNPLIQVNFYRMMEGINRAAEEDPSAPSYLKYATNILAGPFGSVAMFTPVSFIVPFQIAMEMAGVQQNDRDTHFDKIANFFYINPVIMGALAAIGISEETPDPTATSALRSNVRTAINLAKAAGIGEMEPTDDIVEQYTTEIINWGRRYGPGFTSKPLTKPERDEYDNRRIAYYLVEEMRANGIDPDSPEADEYWLDWATGSRDTDLYENAYRKWATEGAMMRGAQLVAPLQTTYKPQDETNYMARQATEARNAGEPLTPEMEEASFIRSMGNTGSAQAAQLQIGLNQRDRLGDENIRETYRHYNDMVYNGIEEIQEKWPDVQQVHIAVDKVFPLQTWVQFTEDEKRMLMDEWLHNTNQYRQFEQYVNERGAFTDANPLVQGYSDFAQSMRGDETGQLVAELTEKSPAFGDWWEQQRGDDPAAALRSPDAYLASEGYKPTIYDKIDPRATDFSKVSLADLRSGGSGGGEQYFAKSFDEMTPNERISYLYQELRSYTNREQKYWQAAEAMFPGIAGMPRHRINPPTMELIRIRLGRMGLQEPQPSGVLNTYLNWAAQVPPDSQDIRNFVMWYGQREQMLYGQGAPNQSAEPVMIPEVGHGDRVSRL